jgi:hypothetical protein
MDTQNHNRKSDYEVMIEYINNHPGCTQKEVVAVLYKGGYNGTGIKNIFQKMSKEKVIRRGKKCDGELRGYYLTHNDLICNTNDCIKW